jgi:hypothetical protein
MDMGFDSIIAGSRNAFPAFLSWLTANLRAVSHVKPGLVSLDDFSGFH